MSIEKFVPRSKKMNSIEQITIVSSSNTIYKHQSRDLADYEKTKNGIKLTFTNGRIIEYNNVSYSITSMYDFEKEENSK